MSRAAGITDEQLQALANWRESDLFTPLERLALEYADALTSTPAVHKPDLLADLRDHLSEKQLVELTNAIAFENFRARFNRAFDVQPQGFSAGAFCVLADHRGSGGSPRP